MRSCAYCGKSNRCDQRRLTCTKCRCASYCSKSCQTRHWCIHKITCLDKLSAVQGTINDSSTSAVDELEPGEAGITWHELKESGNHLFLSEKYALAMELYSAAIRLDATEPALLTNRAACHMELGQYAKVVMDCDAALLLDEKWLRAYERKAEALKRMQRFEEANAVSKMWERSQSLHETAVIQSLQTIPKSS